MLTDAGSDPVLFSGVGIVPSGDPMMLADGVERAETNHVLVVAPQALLRSLQVGVTIAAGRRPEIALAWFASEHAPLALLSAMALARTATDDPAIGVDLTRKLLTASWSGAWTNSVAKLHQPTPRLGQHLRSMVPGSGFLIRQSPRPAVLDRARKDDVPSVGRGRVLLVQDGAVPAAIAQRLAKTEGVSAVRNVVVPGAWATVYGTDRSGQLALIPADPHRLMVRPELCCPSCLLPQSAAVCPFCRVLSQPLVQQGHVLAPPIQGNRWISTRPANPGGLA